MYTGRSLFNVKRLILLGLMALVLSTSLVLSTGVVSAQTTSLTRATTHATASCYNTGCDGKDPIAMRCDSNVITPHAATSSDLGGGLLETVALRYSSACGAAWADVYFNEPLPYTWAYGNAIITRNNDGRQFDCAHGGNGIVLPSQTSCYSGMVGDAGALNSWAAAMYRTDSTSWQQKAGTASF